MVRGHAPRAREGSVRLRRLVGASGGPSNSPLGRSAGDASQDLTVAALRFKRSW